MVFRNRVLWCIVALAPASCSYPLYFQWGADDVPSIDIMAVDTPQVVDRDVLSAFDATERDGDANYNDANAAQDSADIGPVSDADVMVVADGQAPDGRAALDRSRLLGLSREDIAVSAHPSFVQERLLIYWITRDGSLVVDERAESDLRRLCFTSLGRPPGVEWVSSPAVTAPRNVVVVSGRTGVGAAPRLWSRELVIDGAAPCGYVFSDWVALPDLPLGQTAASAPGAASMEYVNQLHVSVLTDDQRLLLTTREPVAGAPWSSWSQAPAPPVDSRLVGRPQVSQFGEANFSIAAELPGSAFARCQMLRFDSPFRWAALWRVLPVPQRLRSPAEEGYSAQTGVTHTIAVTEAGGLIGQDLVLLGGDILWWGDWFEIARPQADAPLLSAHLAFLGLANWQPHPLMIVAVTAETPRRLAFTSQTRGVWDATQSGTLRFARDPLD